VFRLDEQVLRIGRLPVRARSMRAHCVLAQPAS